MPNDTRARKLGSWSGFVDATNLVAPPMIDLADTSDGVKEAVFIDNAHTNELGAEIIARDIYPHLGLRGMSGANLWANRRPDPLHGASMNIIGSAPTTMTRLQRWYEMVRSCGRAGGTLHPSSSMTRVPEELHRVLPACGWRRPQWDRCSCLLLEADNEVYSSHQDVQCSQPPGLSIVQRRFRSG